jgi:acyl-CoA synthetase (AMP-forming)/AMP-acid ligase II
MPVSLVDSVLDITIDKAFRDAVSKFPQHSFIAVPAALGRGYCDDGFEISYLKTLEKVDELKVRLKEAGYGVGDRIAIALDNRPEHIFFRLSLSSLGISCVPVNPDYKSSELSYLLEHSESDLIVYLKKHEEKILEANQKIEKPVNIWCLEDEIDAFPLASSAPIGETISATTESSLLYTSGTTGQPKGCRLSNQYELMSGAWYADLGGMSSILVGKERVFNPLPLYHVNAGIVSLFGMMLTGGCQIQPDRFHPGTFWKDLVETKATIMHYLGVVAPMLLNQPWNPQENSHSIRFGLGAGVEPGLHKIFEERFGFPLIEIWGMTEMVRLLAANESPRKRGTRAMGKPVLGLEVEIRDENDQKVPPETAGEMVLRYSAETPRLGAFLGYLKDDAATELAWKGGWFHTGDNVYQSNDGMLHFVDRLKNIIRRSGENIAAAEVEGVLQECKEVAQVAVIAVTDSVREEEVLACIVTVEGVIPTKELARELFDYCNTKLAYFKSPGWIKFQDELPKTGSQKIQKHLIFQSTVDPFKMEGLIDLRSSKRRI